MSTLPHKKNTVPETCLRMYVVLWGPNLTSTVYGPYSNN